MLATVAWLMLLLTRIPGAEMSNSSCKWTRRLVLQRGLQLGAMGVATPLAINLAAIGEAAAFDSHRLQARWCASSCTAATTTPTPSCRTIRLTTRCITRSARGAAGEDRGRHRAGARRSRRHGADAQRRPGAHRQSAIRIGAAARRPQGAVGQRQAGGAAQRGSADPAHRLGQYRSTNRVANPLPPKLFSHNDQQSIWQSNGSEGAAIGWGGRLGDIALSSNSTNSLLTCISASRQRGVRRRAATRCSTRSAPAARSRSAASIRHRPTGPRCAPR